MYKVTCDGIRVPQRLMAQLLKYLGGHISPEAGQLSSKLKACKLIVKWEKPS